MNANVIVWDLETVPDLRGFAAANGLAGKTDEEVREAIGGKFPADSADSGQAFRLKADSESGRSRTAFR
jgi:hypothetical protein